MSIIEATILGLVQGLTEFIPVSSSGHLLLAHKILGTSDSNLAFDVALHFGTLVALLIYFRTDLSSLARQLTKQTTGGRLARLLLLATVPAALAGLLFNGFIEDNLRSSTVVAFSLAAVGVLMLLADKYAHDKESSEITRNQGLKVGFAQALALIPGVSRSGVTMTAGLATGMSRIQAARFSFLLAIPIISGSTLGILLKGDLNDSSVGIVSVGIIAAFISGILAIKFLLNVIARVGLKPFAYYRIAVALIVLLFLV